MICYIYHVFFVLEPEWSGEALRIMAGLTAGQLLHAQVAGYDEAGLPLVHLYLTLHPQVSCVTLLNYVKSISMN